MANKITQLVNKDGDNLYPLSGGLLSDSVTTDMLQDESVTPDKIDWTTINGSGSITLGNILIQWGKYRVSNGTWRDFWNDYQRTDVLEIPLPIAFASAPTFVSAVPDAKFSFWVTPVLFSTTASKIALQCCKPDGQGGDPSTTDIIWIAIGPKA